MDKVLRVNPHILVNAIAEHLIKEDIKLPKDSDLIKTGFGKQYSPNDEKWFYVRMASIVRAAMKTGHVSIKGLSMKYSVRYNRGVRPSGFATASKAVIGSAIENLKSIGWFNFDQKIILTEKAVSVLDEIIEKLNEEEAQEE